ncbi:MAG: hypothetical protein KJZ78_29185, partial [Bryobacteraceae bacterium]|nr:hypothetical protein [Bryobacteraceae bacterium]
MTSHETIIGSLAPRELKEAPYSSQFDWVEVIEFDRKINDPLQLGRIGQDTVCRKKLSCPCDGRVHDPFREAKRVLRRDPDVVGTSDLAPVNAAQLAKFHE